MQVDGIIYGLIKATPSVPVVSRVGPGQGRAYVCRNREPSREKRETYDSSPWRFYDPRASLLG